MSIANAKNKKIRLVKPLLVIEPNLDVIDYKAKAIAAEPTGTGNTLCLESPFGRLFRADEKTVEKKILEYQEEYRQACKRMNEEQENHNKTGLPIPSDVFMVISWNYLYEKLNLIPSEMGDAYGYTNSPEAQTDLYFEYYFHTNDDYSEKYGEPVFVFGPCKGALPDPWYMDV